MSIRVCMNSYEGPYKTLLMYMLVGVYTGRLWDKFHNSGLVAKTPSSGFPIKRVSNRYSQPQRLARKLKFHL